MAGKTAAPWEVDFPEAADEVKVYPALGQKMSERTSTLFGEHILILKKRAASYEAKSGELGLQEKAGETTTLPLAATGSQLIGVTTKVACKVTTSGGATIYGLGTEGAGTVELTNNMTAFFFSDGTNWQVWGEIKKTLTYVNKVFTKAEAEAGVEPSATRAAVVVLSLAEEATKIEVGAITIASGKLAPESSVTIPYVSPGVKWKANAKVTASTQLL
jgi:hypothetical protein